MIALQGAIPLAPRLDSSHQAPTPSGADQQLCVEFGWVHEWQAQVRVPRSDHELGLRDVGPPATATVPPAGQEIEDEVANCGQDEQEGRIWH